MSEFETENEELEVAEATADTMPDVAHIRLLQGSTYRVMGHVITKESYTKTTNKKLMALALNAKIDVNFTDGEEIRKEWRPLFDVKFGDVLSAPAPKPQQSARARGRVSA